MSESFKQELKGVLDCLVSNINEQAKDSKLFKFLVSKPSVLESPSEFFFSTIYENHLAVSEAIKAVKKLPKDTESEYVSIFLDHAFYDGHVENLCAQIEGWVCSGDKSSTIIKRYMRYLQTGEKGNWDPQDPKCFWLPKFGTQDQWYEFVHSLYLFKYGHPEKYFKAYAVLLESSKEAKKPTSS